MEAIAKGYARRSILKICVDSVGNQEFAGSLLSPYLGFEKFDGVLALVHLMETHFNKASYPQSAIQMRSFKKQSVRNRTSVTLVKGNSGMDEKMKKVSQAYAAQEDKTGDKATFLVHVRFRQNATWQGSIKWLNENKTQNFRSTLELLNLMEDALSEDGGPTVTNKWEKTAASETNFEKED